MDSGSIRQVRSRVADGVNKCLVDEWLSRNLEQLMRYTAAHSGVDSQRSCDVCSAGLVSNS